MNKRLIYSEDLSQEEINDLKTKWESGEINEISNMPDDPDGESVYEIVRYVPECDVTLFLKTFFEGYFNDGFVEEFYSLHKGRLDWHSIEYYLKY